jgi:hypothetical protein
MVNSQCLNVLNGRFKNSILNQTAGNFIILDDFVC